MKTISELPSIDNDEFKNYLVIKIVSCWADVLKINAYFVGMYGQLEIYTYNLIREVFKCAFNFNNVRVKYDLLHDVFIIVATLDCGEEVEYNTEIGLDNA